MSWLKMPERFWSKVDIRRLNECWLWLANRGNDGYGKFSFHGKNHHAQRIAWILTYGEIPDGLLVLHDCPGGDNPLCCNPNHLWLGTDADNMHDMAEKGRAASGDKNASRKYPGIHQGTKNGRAKLNNADIPEIIDLLKNHTQKEVANLFCVSKATIRFIALGKTWKHIPRD